VFTWLTEVPETSFAGDVSPLLQFLWMNDLVSRRAYLGLVGFGTETWHSKGNVTFSARKYGLDVLVGPPPVLDLPPAPDCLTSSGVIAAAYITSRKLFAIVVGTVCFVHYLR
jgi:hypothetical protein